MMRNHSSFVPRLLARKFSLTVEHSLGALGIAIAVGSSVFASYMISHDQGQAKIERTAEEPISNRSQAAHFGYASVDPMPTGSIAPVAGSASLKRGPAQVAAPEPRLNGYVLHDVFEGVALVEGHDGIRVVKPGFSLPGGNRVTAIERRQGKWVVVTTGGIILKEP